MWFLSVVILVWLKTVPVVCENKTIEFFLDINKEFYNKTISLNTGDNFHVLLQSCHVIKIFRSRPIITTPLTTDANQKPPLYKLTTASYKFTDTFNSFVFEGSLQKSPNDKHRYKNFTCNLSIHVAVQTTQHLQDNNFLTPLIYICVAVILVIIFVIQTLIIVYYRRKAKLRARAARERNLSKRENVNEDRNRYSSPPEHKNKVVEQNGKAHVYETLEDIKRKENASEKTTPITTLNRRPRLPTPPKPLPAPKKEDVYEDMELNLLTPSLKTNSQRPTGAKSPRPAVLPKTFKAAASQKILVSELNNKIMKNNANARNISPGESSDEEWREFDEIKPFNLYNI